MKQSDLKLGMQVYNTRTGETWEVVAVNKFGQVIVMRTIAIKDLGEWVKR